MGGKHPLDACPIHYLVGRIAAGLDAALLGLPAGLSSRSVSVVIEIAI